MSVDSKNGYRLSGVWIGPNGSFKEGELPGEYISNGSFSIKTPQLYSNFFPTIVRMVFQLTTYSYHPGNMYSTVRLAMFRSVDPRSI